MVYYQGNCIKFVKTSFYNKHWQNIENDQQAIRFAAEPRIWTLSGMISAWSTTYNQDDCSIQWATGCVMFPLNMYKSEDHLQCDHTVICLTQI